VRAALLALRTHHGAASNLVDRGGKGPRARVLAKPSKNDLSRIAGRTRLPRTGERIVGREHRSAPVMRSSRFFVCPAQIIGRRGARCRRVATETLNNVYLVRICCPDVVCAERRVLRKPKTYAG